MDKTELFREAINAQADEEASARIAELRERKASADKTRSELASKETLDSIRNETNRINTEYRREMSKCDYDMKKAVLIHRNELINGFFEETEQRLSVFAKSAEYGAYLKRSLEKIKGMIALDNSAVVYAREQDIPAVRELTSCEVAVDNTIVIGGLRAVCKTKNVFCDATLDMALEDEKLAFTEKTELRL